MESLTEEWFKQYYLNLQRQWLQRPPSENYAYYEAWQAYMAEASAVHLPAPPASAENQEQHVPPPPPAATEDEEAHQGPGNYDTEQDAPQVWAYISIFRDIIEGASVRPAQQLYREMSVDSSSDTTHSQAGTSFQNTPVHEYERDPSTSSFNPYGEHSSYPAYGFMPSMANIHTPRHCGECNEPTDLSMRKRNHDEANHTDAYDSDEDVDDDDDDDDGHTPMQHSHQVRYPTYIHLSDVSNDSVDAGGKKQQTASQPDEGTGKWAYSDFVPRPPNGVDPHFAAALLSDVEKKVRKVFDCCRTVLERNLSANKLQKITLLIQAELEKNSGQVLISEEDTEANHNGECHGNPNEEVEIIDLSEDDHMDAADSAQEAGPSSPHVDQEEPHIEQATPGSSAPDIDHVQPLEPQAMYSTPENPPPAAQQSPTPAQECMLSAQLDDADMESTATSEKNAAASPQSASFFLGSHVQNCTAEEAAENGLEAMVRTAETLSGSPAEPPSHDHTMELLFVAESTPAPEQSPRTVSPSVLEKSQSLVGSSSRCERKSREPWYNRSLLSFVAEYAFTVPHYVWTEPKEGELRRSRRLANRLNVYFLRER